MAGRWLAKQHATIPILKAAVSPQALGCAGAQAERGATGCAPTMGAAIPLPACGDVRATPLKALRDGVETKRPVRQAESRKKGGEEKERGCGRETRLHGHTSAVAQCWRTPKPSPLGRGSALLLLPAETRSPHTQTPTSPSVGPGRPLGGKSFYNR